MPAIELSERLAAQLQICAVHRRRLLWARAHLLPTLPLNAPSYTALDDAQIEHWDQLIWRFTKLQDYMGERVFRSLLGLMQEPVLTAPFIDQLARLEQLGVLEKAEDWLALRQARNQSAHEYAESPEEGAAVLNSLLPMVDLLLQVQARVEAASERFLAHS